MPRLLLTILLLLCAAGCGTGSTDALEGSWQLQEVRCQGALTAIPADVTSLELTFNEDGTFAVRWTGPACASAEFTGTYERIGLDVIATNTFMDCGAGCIAGPLNCTGTSAVADAETRYRVSIPTADDLETYVASVSTFCATGYQTEAQVYRRID